MTSTGYIELTSAHRRRDQYPNPSQFTVELSQSGLKDRGNAVDPVSDASPVLVWNTSFDETTAATSVTITAIDQTFSPSDPSTFLIQATANDLRDVENYYVGAVLELTDSAGTPVTVRTRILAYERISTTQAQVTVETALPSSFPTGALAGTSVIENPTNATNADAVPKVFIPASEAIDNYYVNYSIENITTGETFTITAFDGTTHLATLNTNTAATWLQTNHNIVIRKAVTANTGTLRGVSANGKVLQLATGASAQTDAYLTGYVRMVEPIPLAAGGFSTETAPYNEERRIISYIAGNGTFDAHGGAGTNTFTLSAGANLTANYYVNAFITDTTTGETRQVATYNGANRTGTVTANWGAGAAGDNWEFRTVFLNNAFTTNPVVGGADNYEIEAFTTDNYSPMNYSGSMVSVQQQICYEVELINLILPNVTLSSGRGGRIAFYPYLYVELQNVSSTGSGISRSIYSNNPNSTKMLFRAAIDDTPTPLISPFVKIDGDGMVQTIAFRPNDALQFSVYHSNGELFQPVEADTTDPKEPNPLLQISALFSFKRLEAGK